MDMFAIGCVWFEVIALFPLFPGTNEVDQVNKIHNVLGTPSPEVMRRMRVTRQSEGANFAHTRGTGIERLIPHVSTELHELLSSLLKYDPDERTLARHVLKLPYFNGVELLCKKPQTGSSISSMPSIDFEEPKNPGKTQMQPPHDASDASGKKVLPPIPSPRNTHVKKHHVQEHSKAQFKHAAASTMTKASGSHISNHPADSNMPQHAQYGGSHPSKDKRMALPNQTIAGKATFGTYDNPSGGIWGQQSYGNANQLMNTMTKQLAMTGQFGGNFTSNANQTYHPQHATNVASSISKRSYVSPYSQRHVAVRR